MSALGRCCGFPDRYVGVGLVTPSWRSQCLHVSRHEGNGVPWSSYRSIRRLRETCSLCVKRHIGIGPSSPCSQRSAALVSSSLEFPPGGRDGFVFTCVLPIRWVVVVIVDVPAQRWAGFRLEWPCLSRYAFLSSTRWRWPRCTIVLFNMLGWVPRAVESFHMSPFVFPRRRIV
jgi:hypothetical protein